MWDGSKKSIEYRNPDERTVYGGYQQSGVGVVNNNNNNNNNNTRQDGFWPIAGEEFTAVGSAGSAGQWH